MKHKLKFSGLKSLEKKFEKMTEAQMETIENALITAAFRVDRAAKRSIQKQSRGKEYKKGSITHVTSKPGDPPNTDTGALVQSIGLDVTDRGIRPAVTVGTRLKYGTYLEFGTQDMDARPWLFPAFKSTQKQNEKSIAAAIKKAIQQVASKGAG